MIVPSIGDSGRSLPSVTAVATVVVLATLCLTTTGCEQAVADVEQPIAFDHAVHAEEGIRCVRCHLGAESQSQAGLMRVERCAACHRRVIPEHPEVAKVLEHWQAGESIFWRRVAWIPESSGVQFSHAAHFRAEIECSTCHGDVASMTVAQPPSDHSVDDMDWCVDCHREREASIDCLTCHY